MRKTGKPKKLKKFNCKKKKSIKILKKLIGLILIL